MTIEIIVISGIAIGLFVLVYLLKHKGLKLLSCKFALAILLLWLLRLTLLFLKITFENIENAYLAIYDQILFLLDGLLLWLYVKALLRPNEITRRIWFHFIPFGIALVLSTASAFFNSEWVVQEYNQTIERLKTEESILSIGVVVYITFILIINLFYLVQSVKITKSYNYNLKQNLSTIDNLRINWVKKFQIIWIILFLIPVAIYFVNYMTPFMERIAFLYLVASSLTLLSIVFNYFLLEQHYRPVSLFKENLVIDSDSVNRKQQDLLKNLDNLLTKEQYYLDEELSLGQLADYMKLKSVELTALIKSSNYENFYDLINSYRIEEIKKQLYDSDEQIIQLAYQNGFKSKSTFNKIFKQKTGMTPKEYRLSLK